MSEKLKDCPFCGNKPEKVGAFSAECRGLVDGKDIHNTIVMNNEAWNRRTAAPEGEVACVIAFREGRREPEFISWNKMPVGEHRLYAALRPTDTGRKA